MTWREAFQQLDRTVASRAELRAIGATGKSLTAAVRGHHLLRLRRDHYALPDIDPHVERAVRVGGRLGCISALAAAGIFVHDHTFTHICVDPLASRLRSPRHRFIPLRASGNEGIELHWVDLIEPDSGDETTVDIRDALLQSLHCQSDWETVASFDNALFLGRVTPSEVSRIFDAGAQKFSHLASRLNSRAESGSESRLRLILEDAGLSCEVQVLFDKVGRVDTVVEGRLVVEADSRVGHAGWEKQLSDRTRDLELAKLGLMSLRPTSEHIFGSPDLVRDAVLALLDSRGPNLPRIGRTLR